MPAPDAKFDLIQPLTEIEQERLEVRNHQLELRKYLEGLAGHFEEVTKSRPQSVTPDIKHGGVNVEP